MLTSIKSKILLLVVVLMTVTTLAVIFITKENFEIEMQNLHTKLAQDALQSAVYILENEYDELIAHELNSIAKQRELMENMSTGVLAMIHSHYELYTFGIVSENEAKKSSLHWINTFRYGSDQYFFVCDTDLTGLAHPLKSMIGKQWTGFQDVKLKDALLLMKETVQENNYAYTVFQWPTLSDQTLVKQMGFFRYYPEWEWIIGTTAQIGDLKRNSRKKLDTIIKKLENIFLHMKFAETGYIFLFNGNGEMLIHPEMSGENIADDVLMQKLVAATESPEKSIEYSSAFGGEDQQRHLTYVKYFKALDWYVAASISHEAITNPARRLAIRQAHIMLTILLGGILIASVLSRKIAQPLVTLSQYTRGLPEKDLTGEKIHSPIKLRTTSSEINQLAESFAFMETQLREHLKELNKYHVHLEELVEARTSELTHMNQQLQQEIIERKQIEEKLIKFEREKATILNAMSEMFAYYYDENLVVQWANKASGDSVGMVAEELVGQHCYKIWQQRSEPCERCPVIKAFETGKTQEMEVTTTDGRVWFIRGCPVFNETDEIVGVVEITQNITERKRAEEQIKNQNILLEQAVQEKQWEMEALFERLLRQEKLATIGQIAGNIAHELRNPLGAVKQSAFFLERLYQRHQLDASNPKVKEHLDLIEAELDISGRVISDLLQMTRMKVIQREQTDLHSILVDAANHCHLPENIQLTIDLLTEPFLIRVDSLQLRQVFINLLTNAVQSIEENGHITISAKQLTGERSCVIEVEDNGIGIEPDLLDRVFEPLYTSKATGTGLGLSICKQIIENHQGQISVKSRKDQGTTVTIVLPE